MLIQEAINLLSAQIINLGWVGLFGGVTQRVSVPQSTENGVIYKSIPVSCNAAYTDCIKNNRYKELIPDSGKRSVVYWEVTQGFSDNGEDNHRRRRILQGQARLVGWINTNLLGINECNTAAKAIRSLMPILYQRFDSATSGALFENSSVEFEFISEEVKSSEIFGYDYGKNKDGFLLHPYDYFALNVKVTARLALCQYAVTALAPIECTDYSQLP